MDIVRSILEKQQRDCQKYKPIAVEKHLECREDLGLLLLSDPNELVFSEHDNRETTLLQLTRDNTQLLLNSIWELPTERLEECIVAKLPAPSITLPRLRKVPAGKVLTKWEKFAQEKGITKKKKMKKEFDSVLNKWVPTYGFRRAEAEKSKDWVLEVPKNADPNEDMFQKKIDLRNEKVAKNEIQRMKNIVRAKKLETPRTGYLGPDVASSKQLLTAMSIAKASTASVGKFQEKIPKEKAVHGVGIRELIPGSKKKVSHVTERGEKEINMNLIKSVLSKKPKFDAEKAISLQKREEKIGKQSENRSGPKTGKVVKKSKMSRKPKSNYGQKAPSKKISHGKKRR